MIPITWKGKMRPTSEGKKAMLLQSIKSNAYGEIRYRNLVL